MTNVEKLNEKISELVDEIRVQGESFDETKHIRALARTAGELIRLRMVIENPSFMEDSPSTATEA